MEDILSLANHLRKVAFLQHLENKRLRFCNVYCEFL